MQCLESLQSVQRELSGIEQSAQKWLLRYYPEGHLGGPKATIIASNTIRVKKKVNKLTNIKSFFGDTFLVDYNCRTDISFSFSIKFYYMNNSKTTSKILAADAIKHRI